MTVAHRHRRGGLPFGKTVVIVLSIHALAGGGLLFLAKTQAGREIARTYHIKLFQPHKPPPKPPVAKAKPPPPKLPALVKAPAAAPQLPKLAAAAPPSDPQIGGGGVDGAIGAGVNWSGGIFAGGFDGPDGAFNASVTARFRKYYHEPGDSFGSAQLQMVVTGRGQVSSYRLLRSSGDASNDRAILAAAEKVKDAGVAAPPKGKGRIVTVRFVPY